MQFPMEVDGGFTLNAAPASQSVAIGGSFVSAITATSACDHSPYVWLSAEAYDSNGNDVTNEGIVDVYLSTAWIGMNDGSYSTATITVGPNAVNGEMYYVDVTGQDEYVNTADAWIDVTVGSPGLTLQANPATVTVTPPASDGTGGTQATSAILVQPSGGLAGAVTLAASIADSSGNQVPTGFTIGFNPSTPGIDSNDDPITSIATIAADDTVPAGTYTATIIGKCDPASATTSITITVNGGGLAHAHGGRRHAILDDS